MLANLRQALARSEGRDHTFGAPLVVTSDSCGCAPVRVFDINADGGKDITVVHQGGFEVGMLLARGAVLGPEARP